MDFEFKKAFGQNFLNDHNIIENIVKKSNIEKKDSLVIEIGPGAGVLTRELSKAADQVLCYEIDTRLEEILDENLSGLDNIDIIFDDFLNRNIKEDLKKYKYKNLYLVANLPYYITTPIIESLIHSKLDFKSITVMVQKEVGDRFSAEPGCKDYGSITAYLNYYFTIEKLFIVSRNCFIPKPNVDSIVIKLTKHNKYKVDNEFALFKLIKDAFRFKRKNIRNNLKTYDLKKIEKVLEKYNYDLTVRSECLPIEVFIDIANTIGDKILKY